MFPLEANSILLMNSDSSSSQLNKLIQDGIKIFEASKVSEKDHYVNRSIKKMMAMRESIEAKAVLTVLGCIICRDGLEVIKVLNNIEKAHLLVLMHSFESRNIFDYVLGQFYHYLIENNQELAVKLCKKFIPIVSKEKVLLSDDEYIEFCDKPLKIQKLDIASEGENDQEGLLKEDIVKPSDWPEINSFLKKRPNCRYEKPIKALVGRNNDYSVSHHPMVVCNKILQKYAEANNFDFMSAIHKNPKTVQIKEIKNGVILTIGYQVDTLQSSDGKIFKNAKRPFFTASINYCICESQGAIWGVIQSIVIHPSSEQFNKIFQQHNLSKSYSDGELVQYYVEPIRPFLVLQQKLNRRDTQKERANRHKESISELEKDEDKIGRKRYFDSLEVTEVVDLTNTNITDQQISAASINHVIDFRQVTKNNRKKLFKLLLEKKSEHRKLKLTGLNELNSTKLLERILQNNPLLEVLDISFCHQLKKRKNKSSVMSVINRSRNSLYELRARGIDLRQLRSKKSYQFPKIHSLDLREARHFEGLKKCSFPNLRNLYIDKPIDKLSKFMKQFQPKPTVFYCGASKKEFIRWFKKNIFNSVEEAINHLSICKQLNKQNEFLQGWIDTLFFCYQHSGLFLSSINQSLDGEIGLTNLQEQYDENTRKRLKKLLSILHTENFELTTLIQFLLGETYQAEQGLKMLVAEITEQISTSLANQENDAALKLYNKYLNIFPLDKDMLQARDQLLAHIRGEDRPLRADDFHHANCLSPHQRMKNMGTIHGIYSQQPDNQCKENHARVLNRHALVIYVGLYNVDYNEMQRLEALFQQSLELYPNYPDTLNNLAVVKKHLGKFQEAYSFISRAAQLQPSDPDILYNLSNISKDVNNEEKQYFALEQLSKLNCLDSFLTHEYEMLYKKTHSVSKHWYSDDEINNLLNYYLRENEEVMLFTAILATDLKRGNDLYANLLQFQDQRYQALQKGIYVESKVIIPINLYQNHWALIYLVYPQGKRIPDIYYFDPFGKTIPKEVETVLFHHHLFLGAKFRNIGERVQWDGHNCGPWVVEVARSIANNGALPTARFNIELARELHEKILIQMNQQKDNTVKLPIPELDSENSFPVIETDPDISGESFVSVPSDGESGHVSPIGMMPSSDEEDCAKIVLALKKYQLPNIDEYSVKQMEVLLKHLLKENNEYQLVMSFEKLDDEFLSDSEQTHYVLPVFSDENRWVVLLISIQEKIKVHYFDPFSKKVNDEISKKLRGIFYNTVDIKPLTLFSFNEKIQQHENIFSGRWVARLVERLCVEYYKSDNYSKEIFEGETEARIKDINRSDARYRGIISSRYQAKPASKIHGQCPGSFFKQTLIPIGGNGIDDPNQMKIVKLKHR